MTDITRFMQRPDGVRNLEVTLANGVRVLVQPTSGDGQEQAEAAARLIADHDGEMRLAAAEHERLRRALATTRAALDSARAATEALLTGRPRLFGNVLLKPASASEWTGPVWLLDPDKQERGYGLRFDSLADARAAFPELWPVGNTPDGVLMALVPLARKEES